MSVVNLDNIVNLLRPGVNSVFGEYKAYPKLWKDYGFETRKSNMAYETVVEMQYPGMASIVGESQNIPSTSGVGQRYVTTFRHIKLAIKNTLSKESIDDNLYKTQFPDNVKASTKSLEEACNTLASAILNNAFRIDPQFLMGDGKPVASTEHPYYSGVYANTFPAGSPAIDFSEYGLEQALTIIQKFPDQAGLLANIKARKLIVALSNQFAAARLLKSTYTPGSANNAINAINSGNYFPEGFVHSPYITNPNSWFIKTDAENGLTHFSREEAKFDMFPNYNNQTISYQAFRRDSWGIANPRGLFCAA